MQEQETKRKCWLRTVAENVVLVTGLSADLIAIIPVIHGLLTHFKIVRGELITLPVSINIGISIPVENTAYVLIFYGFVIYAYRVVRRNNVAFIRDICIGISLLVAFPVSLLLITFGKLSLADGLAVACLCLVTTFYYKRQFHFDRNDPSLHPPAAVHEADPEMNYLSMPIRIGRDPRIWYTDVGYWYFLWVLLVWILLQINSTTTAWVNFEWALLYTAIGYAASILIVRIVGFIWQTRLRNPGMFPGSRLGFDFEGNLLSTMALAIVMIISYVAFGFYVFPSLYLRILWIALPFILAVLFFLMLWRSSKTRQSLDTIDRRGSSRSSPPKS